MKNATATTTCLHFDNDPTTMNNAGDINIETPLNTDTVLNASINGSSDKATIAKLSAQLKKLNDANSKYKNLLKLAKDRIEKQEEETSTLKQDHASLLERIFELEEKDVLSSTKSNIPTSGDSSLIDRNGLSATTVGTASSASTDAQIVRISQRVQCPISDDLTEIWALVEFQTTNDDGTVGRKFKEWKRFDAETQLRDYVRRDTGEPIVLPPYSLSPEQSSSVQLQADLQVSKITEEFRRYRVRTEMSRKQAEGQIRELQLALAQKVTQRIENSSLNGGSVVASNTNETERLRSLSNQLDRLKADMAIQESHWKESYETLLAENQALQSSGSDALLAAQWRQRYELCLKEKENLESRMSVSSPTATGSEYEAKYRDLKESFRLYRKKAKEIFEAQQQSHGAVSSAAAMTITGSASAESKLSYLKNLMINYLMADPSVREHMLVAIGTVLQFTTEEKQCISAKNTKDSSWF